MLHPLGISSGQQIEAPSGVGEAKVPRIQLDPKSLRANDASKQLLDLKAT